MATPPLSDDVVLETVNAVLEGRCKGKTDCDIADNMGMTRGKLHHHLRTAKLRGLVGDINRQPFDAEGYRAIAKVWNDPRRYPLMHDMERALGCSSRRLRTMVEDYRRRHSTEFANQPELIPRRADGRVIPMAPGVIRQMEAFAIDPVVAHFRKHMPGVNAMERQDTLILPVGHPKGTLCSMHGDKGPRGAPSRSTRDFAKFNHRVILGHNHTGLIWGPIWRVGTSTPLTQHYVSNPETSWTNTHCVIFANGQRMLVNIIKGQWHGQRELYR